MAGAWLVNCQCLTGLAVYPARRDHNRKVTGGDSGRNGGMNPKEETAAGAKPHPPAALEPGCLTGLVFDVHCYAGLGGYPVRCHYDRNRDGRSAGSSFGNGDIDLIEAGNRTGHPACVGDGSGLAADADGDPAFSCEARR